LQLFEGQTIKIAEGELMLECLALPPKATANLTSPTGALVKYNPFSDDPAPHKDLFLVVKSGDFELCLVPGVRITREPSFEVSNDRTRVNNNPNVVFRVPSPTVTDAFIDIVIPKPATEFDSQDLDTLEILLKQYGSLYIPPQFVNREIPGAGLIDSFTSVSTPDSPAGGKGPAPPVPPRPGMRHSDSQGRFVLVDETTGQIIGELDQNLSVEEGKQVAGGSANEPVIVDFGPLDQGLAKSITVKTVDEADMNDWMLKGAHYLSKGILTLGNSYSSGITSAAEYYTKNTKPSAEPVKLSPMAKGSIRQVHNASTRGLKVTRKTLGIVQDVSNL
jgi:spartin